MRDFLHHLFIPRESNNHRSRLLHHKSLLVILVLLLLGEFFLITAEKRYTGVLGISANISTQELLDLTNQKRAESGLPPLSLSGELTNAATAKATDMFSKNYWAHMAPDGGTPWGFIRGAGYEYLYAGENLARGFTTSTDVINAWMASPGHRENMLSSNYKEVGFAVQTGVLTGDDTVLVVEEFGSRSEGAQSQQVTTVSITPPPAKPSPTVVAVAALIPTSTPTPLPLPTISPSPAPQTVVASFVSTPLMNSDSVRKNIVVIIFGLLLAALILDIVIVMRRKITRVFVHNLDHIIFFGILLLAVLLITKSATL